MHLTPARVLLLLCVLAACGGLLFVLLAALLTWSILVPPRMSAGKAIYHLRRLSPGDLGLVFEEQWFTVEDRRDGRRLRLTGWWIPSSVPSDGCVILLHGYADAKVGAIAWAPILHELSLNILAIDLRAHGDSGGQFCTGGFFERDDISQLIEQIRINQPGQTRRIFLFGASLGAAIAIGVAAGRSDITAIILESPFSDYARAIARHMQRMNLPGGLLTTTAIAAAQRISGARFSEVRPVDLLAKLTCPALTIVGSDDPLLDETDITALEQATRQNPRSEFWLVQAAGHLQAMAVDPVKYRLRVAEFLGRSK
jgi:pimeloyl-ACP methyl ester carboxylesterase